MAITINSEPTGVLFAYRPLVSNVTSDSVDIVRVIADIYVSGSYITSLETSPDLGTTDDFTFDIQGVIQDNLDNLNIRLDHGIGTVESILKSIYCKFYEVDLSSGVLSTNWLEDGAGTPEITGTTFQALNGTLDIKETNSITPFQAGGTYGQLSKWYGTTRIKKGDTIPLVVVYSGSTVQLRLKQYQADGTLISNTTPLTVGTTFDVIHSRYDTDNLATNTNYFTLQIETSGSVAITNEYRYDVVNDCGNDFTTINWFNSLGGIDYQLFESRKVKKVRSNTRTYKQALPTSFDSKNRGNTMYNINGSEVFEVYTTTLSEVKLLHLAELITHKSDVFVIENNEEIPIIITSASEIINDSENKARSFKITYQYSNKLVSQRG